MTEAHVVVVAKDSGIPPRETSVPVVVHFPNHRASELKAKEDEAFTLMVVFGLVLSVLFIVIVLMAAYIWYKFILHKSYPLCLFFLKVHVPILGD